jgi:hypothetical protein
MTQISPAEALDKAMELLKKAEEATAEEAGKFISLADRWLHIAAGLQPPPP